MADAQFTPAGVTLDLSKEEWWFVSAAMSHVLYGDRMPDHDFRNILMSVPSEAERLNDQLSEAEWAARTSGRHWAPLTPSEAREIRKHTSDNGVASSRDDDR